MLEGCLEKENIPIQIVPIQKWTRENFVALDTETGSQYRFGFPGPPLKAAEQKQVIASITQTKAKYLVLSGSLNENLSDDFYQKIIKKAKASGTKVILDTSGKALEKALESGVWLVKPNIGELAKLMGIEKLKLSEVPETAKKLIAQGSAEIVVVSLGPKGAVLVTKEQTIKIPAPEVPKKSTVGAGDSMLGAMVWALSQNKPLQEVIQWGVACGSAATMNEGTQLFKLKDAKKLFKSLQQK